MGVSTFNTPHIQLASTIELGGSILKGYFETNNNETVLFAKTDPDQIINLEKFLPDGVNFPEDFPLTFTNLFLFANSKGELAFKANTASIWKLTEEFEIHSGELDLKLNPKPANNKPVFTGIIQGKFTLFGIDTAVKVSIAEQLKLSASVAQINVKQILSTYAPQLEIPSELPISDIVIKTLEVKATPQTGAISFEGEATSVFNLTIGDTNIKITSTSFKFKRKENGTISCSIKVYGKGQLSNDIRFPEAGFEFIYNEKGWQLGGNLELNVFDCKLLLKAEATSLDGTNTVSFKSEGKLPTLHIPNALEPTENITSFTFSEFAIGLEQKGGSITKWNVSGTSDFIIWNPIKNGEKLVEMKAGTLQLKGEGKEKSLTFLPEKAEVKPFGVFTSLSEVLRNGVVVGLGELAIKKDEGELSISANAYLQLEETIFNELPGGEIINALFSPPQNGKKLQVKGDLLLSSKKGVSMTLINDGFALTPNPSDIIGNALEEMLKNLEMLVAEKPKLQPLLDGLTTLKKKLPDVGKIYFSLRKIALNLSENLSLEVQLALGLPEKLNELFFANLPKPLKALNKLEGIINTYNPNDINSSVMTATLSLSGEDGISGSLGSFPPVNWGKVTNIVKEVSEDLKRVLADGITFIVEDGKDGKKKKLTDKGIGEEKIKSIVLNFDGIMGEKEGTYGAIAIDIPKIYFSFKSGDFSISGGCRVLSDQLSIPLPFQPLLLLLGLPQAVEYVPKSIPIRSVPFIKNGNLSTDDLEEYLIDCLPKKFKTPFKELFKPFKEVINASSSVVSRFPTAFKDYLGIHLPKGFRFDLSITADKSVNFSLEVDSPVYTIKQEHLTTLKELPKREQLPTELLQKLETLKAREDKYENKPAVSRAIRRILSRYEWENHSEIIIKTITAGDFHDAIQTLVPLIQQPPVPILLGVRIRRIAFGTALVNQVFRVDFSGEINMFNFLELIPALALPAPEEITDETLQLIVPNRHKLQTSILLDQLVVFIIYYTGIPIPVPVFAKELDIQNVSLLGDEEQFRWAVETNTGITSVLKKMLKLKSFFSNKSSWLELQEYPIGSSMKPPELGLTLGPNFLKLPGIFGYEHDEQGNEKQKIAIGTTTPIDINFFDLIGVSANTVKGMILKKNITTPSDNLSPPLNYFIQYLPIEKRVGAKHIKLFHFFDLYAKWLLTTPQEFREGAWKRLQGVQTKNELLSLVPSTSNSPTNEEGFVAFFQGGFGISEVAYFDTAFVMAATEKGFAAGFQMKGVLGDVFSSELKGIVKTVKIIDANNKESTSVNIEGSGELIFCGKKILEGNVNLDKEGVTLSGKIDLFPGNELIRIRGNVDGSFQKDTFKFSGEVLCAFGPLILASAQLTINSQEFVIKATFLNQTITLAIQQKENSLRLFATMTPVKIGDFLQITDVDGEHGPVFYVELNQLNYKKTKTSVVELREAQISPIWINDTDLDWQSTDDSYWTEIGRTTPNIPATKNPFFQNPNLDDWAPSGNQLKVYLSCKVVLLGLESSTYIIFEDNHFHVDVRGNFLDLFSSELKISGEMNASNPVWKGEGAWQGQEKWMNGNDSDWNNFGFYTLTGNINMLGTALKSEGELSIQPLTSSGTMKLWVEENDTSFFKGCDLIFSFQQSKAISKANMTIHGDLIDAALKLALNMVSGKVDNLLEGAIKKLNDFNNRVEKEKGNIKNNAAERKRKAKEVHDFWKSKVDDLDNILNQINHKSLSKDINKYFNEVKGALLAELHKEKNGHTQWYYNGEYRHPWDWFAYNVKQKFLGDVIWYVDTGFSKMLEMANALTPVFNVLYPIIKKIIENILGAARIALGEALKLVNAVIDGETAIAVMALNLVQKATGFTKEFLIGARSEFEKLQGEIQKHIENLPIKIVKTSFDASLNQFQLNSFNAEIELSITPSNGESFNKTITTAIDFNDLNKTAKLLLETNKDILKLNQLPDLEDAVESRSFSNNMDIFSNPKSFTICFKKLSDLWLIKQFNHFDEEKITILHSIYEKSLAIENDYSLHNIVGKLGEAIASLIELAAIEDKITTGVEKKKFVMENIINISRLMDNGISGKENNIHKEIHGFEFLDYTDKTLQEEFVVPMTSKTIESLWSPVQYNS